MSLYLVVWLLLCGLSIKDGAVRGKPATLRVEFWVCLLGLAVMLALRYGQGVDYLSYRRIYFSTSETAITFPHYAWDKEVGFALLCNIFRVLHLPFEGFVALISAAEIGLFYAFARRYCLEEPLTLLLAFPTLYITWFMSGIRQGLVIAVFLGVLFPLLEKKRYLWYLVGVLLCMLIHSAAVVFLALLVADKIHSIARLQILTVLAWLAGIILATPTGLALMDSLGSKRLSDYLSQGVSVNPMACAERLLFLVLVTWLYFRLCRTGRCSGTFRTAYACYLIAMALYGVFLWNDLVASRTCSMMRFVEIYLLVYAARQMTRSSRYLFTLALVALESFMVVKNLNAAAQQGQYRAGVTGLNYPYISILNEEELYQYRNGLNSVFNFSWELTS